MKRIIDGVAYNTDTATVLAQTKWEDKDDRGRDTDVTATLYETPKGAFFLAKEIETTWVVEDRYGDRETKSREDNVFLPMTADEAEAWMLKGDVEVIHNRFAEGVPEAEAEDGQSATLYFRVPETLKQRVVQAAAAADMSTNTWLLRCAEGCLKT